VLELLSERSRNAKKPSQTLCPASLVIGRSLFPRAIPAIGESPASILEGVGITLSFGQTPVTAKRHLAVSPSKTMMINPCANIGRKQRSWFIFDSWLALVERGFLRIRLRPRARYHSLPFLGRTWRTDLVHAPLDLQSLVLTELLSL
jgi:hypothetical protein